MKLSVVVPCYNEEAVLESLLEVLAHELGAITSDYEVVLVDDGSCDGTLKKLRAAWRRDPRFRYLALSRNFGKESAMLAGLTETTGDAVAIIDADLQHPPRLIAEMLRLLDEGYDQVVAHRTRTGDGAVRTLASRIYYRFVNHLIDVHIEDGVGDFRMLSRTAVRAVLTLPEYNRFSKGLFSWIGFDTTSIEYENVAREAGETKWRMRDLLNYGIDSIISFNSRPLRTAIHFGVLASGLAFAYAFWVVIDAITHGNAVPGYVTTIAAIVGFGGLQMILLGVIGEYLGRIYAETKARPHFFVKERNEGSSHASSVAASDSQSSSL